MTMLSAAELDELVAYVTSDPAPASALPETATSPDLEALLAKVDLPRPKRRGPGIVWLTRTAFEALPEYSLSDPTGFRPGLRWKRDVNMSWEGQAGARPSWWLCEYLLRGTTAVITSKKIMVEWDLEIAAQYVASRRARRRTRATTDSPPAVEEAHG